MLDHFYWQGRITPYARAASRTKTDTSLSRVLFEIGLALALPLAAATLVACLQASGGL